MTGRATWAIAEGHFRSGVSNSGRSLKRLRISKNLVASVGGQLSRVLYISVPLGAAPPLILRNKREGTERETSAFTTP